MNKKVLSKEGYQKLIEKIKGLEEELLLIRNDKNLKGENLKENFDEESRYAEETRIIGKIRHYSELLISAEIIEGKENSEELIGIDDVVSTKIAFSEDDTEEFTFRLVSNDTPDIHAEIPEVTISSPLGNSVYRKAVGSSSSYVNGNGTVAVEIIAKNQSLESEKVR